MREETQTTEPSPAASMAGSAAPVTSQCRLEVHAQLVLQVGDRRLVHAPARVEAADEVDDGARGLPRGVRDGARGVRVEEVGLDELEPVATLDAVQLALLHPRDDGAPAVVEEAPRDRGAEAAGPSGDDRCAHVRSPLDGATRAYAHRL